MLGQGAVSVYLSASNRPQIAAEMAPGDFTWRLDHLITH